MTNCSRHGVHHENNEEITAYIDGELFMHIIQYGKDRGLSQKSVVTAALKEYLKGDVLRPEYKIMAQKLKKERETAYENKVTFNRAVFLKNAMENN